MAKCPLTPAHITLIQAAYNARSLDAGNLSGLLCLSPETVRTQWNTINHLLGVHERAAALLMALHSGWITSDLVPKAGGGRQNKILQLNFSPPLQAR